MSHQPHNQHAHDTLSADDGRALIRRLVDPNDCQAVPGAIEQEQRLRMLLYFLREVGFKASGVRCMVNLKVLDTTHTGIFAIALRMGGVDEMFSLHRKIKLSIRVEEDLKVLVDKMLGHLSVGRDNSPAPNIYWNEIYPEPMKQKDLLQEIMAGPEDHTQTMQKLSSITSAWALERNTMSVPCGRARVRL